MKQTQTNKEKVQNIARTMKGKRMHWMDFVKLVKMTTGAKIVREDWAKQVGAVPDNDLNVDVIYLRDHFKPVKRRFPKGEKEWTAEQISASIIWTF